MATMSTTFTASGSFTLTDENGVVVFTFSPSFESGSNTTANVLYTGEQLAVTGGSEIALGDAQLNDDRVYVFVKNVDNDYQIALNASESESSSKDLADIKATECVFLPMELNGDGSGSSIKLISTTSAQKAQYLICDALDN